MSKTLELVPENWHRLMAIVAHPDDLEYGAASAIVRWTSHSKNVSYVHTPLVDAAHADRLVLA
jgi:LmbE family N-acetylglucosaminyl deacetylase